ncbi:MAG: cytochrome c [Acetobacteraceae bacterium]|nr:cytochrome c [Acetobacteraceae bacterium]
MAALLLVAAICPVAAQDLGDVATGRRLAETWCGECHTVTPTRMREVRRVPTFNAIADMTSTTPLSLRAFLQTPHDKMPDLHLNHDETDDLIGYILSLRGR